MWGWQESAKREVLFKCARCVQASSVCARRTQPIGVMQTLGEFAFPTARECENMMERDGTDLIELRRQRTGSQSHSGNQIV